MIKMLMMLGLMAQPGGPGPEKTEKPKYMWFDAEANFKRFSSKDSIRFYLDKTKAAGFNQVVIDVRPIYGDVLYKKTKTMQPLTQVGKDKRHVKWDYLQVFIDEARKRNLKVSVSTAVFPAGHPQSKTGPAYRDKRFEGKTTVEHTPDGIKNIRDDKTKVAAFLNPLMPEVQAYAMNFIREIVSGYDIDGYVLDYCRFADVENDFSDYTRKRFEAHIGQQVAHFPEDIFTWEIVNGQKVRKDGPLAKQWFEFRSGVIHDFIAKARKEIKSLQPDVQLEYWAASWYGHLYSNGQNWASQSYDASKEYPWASATYQKTGFANELDVFMNGTYLEKTYGMQDPESIEFGLARGKRLINGACKMYGSLYALNHSDIEDQVYVCLTQSEGLVMFDIVQVIEFNLWDRLKSGIDRAESDLRK
ncbi:alpha amylase family protein [uncultured Chitinophaga sp.]|uniref:alpha amylase family protein n=1 Tax=uncultured Chitinophaga sp. TaxID=339340 RepID=UPI0026112327|nr:alpha amylase family protein [uncultured Chitinophaga sp.]